MIFLQRRPFNQSFCYQLIYTSIRDYFLFSAFKTAQQALGRHIDGAFDSILIQNYTHGTISLLAILLNYLLDGIDWTSDTILNWGARGTGPASTRRNKYSKWAHIELSRTHTKIHEKFNDRNRLTRFHRSF